jgi:hypothetical protein
MQKKYWHIEFFDAQGHLEHNAICSGFDEIAALAQGRTFLIQGEWEGTCCATANIAQGLGCES